MQDEKRKLREHKRQLKRAGNKKLRRFLKDVNADPGQFDYGRQGSQPLNEPPPQRPPARRREPASTPLDEASDE